MCIRDRLEEQRPEVARVEELDSEARVELAQPAQLAVLIPDQALLERGELHVEVQLGKVEVGAEALEDRAGAVEEDRERLWLVLPGDGIEVEDPGQLHVEVQLGKVEVGAEALEDRAGAVEEDRERLWLVLPGDGIEVEDPGQL